MDVLETYDKQKPNYYNNQQPISYFEALQIV